MALRITSFDGVNLIEQPPEVVQITAEPLLGARATIQCYLIEDGDLPYDYITGTLNWNDGSLPTVYNGTSTGTITFDTYRNFQPGQYVVKVEAHNYAAPVWDTVGTNFVFDVRATQTEPPTVALIYGPILPKDTGFPNPNQWLYNRGTDIEILSSSVKMLLITYKGERMMLPDYGTNLRIILFELQTTGIESLVQQEIVDALTKWEPRVALQFLSVEKTGPREITVNATFVSKLNQQGFTIPLVFTP